jgi:hypothetical protein
MDCDRNDSETGFGLKVSPAWRRTRVSSKYFETGSGSRSSNAPIPSNA